MKSKMLFFCVSLLLFLVANNSAQTKSLYTSLDTKNCKTIKQSNDEGGSYQGVCNGIGNYKLEVLEGDIRQTINVIAPNKKKFELDLWSNVSSGFSNVGQKAEWRMKGTTPIALIVRFSASEDPADSTKITSYLVVSKITKTEVCITDIVKPSKTQNAEAQKLADAAPGKACKVFQ